MDLAYSTSTSSAKVSKDVNSLIMFHGTIPPLYAHQAEGSMGSEVFQRRPLDSPVHTFTSLVECLDAMDNVGDGPEYTVVLYFAHYCKLCHQANIPYKRMAYQASPNEIRFTRLETSILTTSQYEMLGISRVPFIQIYRHGVCVASFSTKWQLHQKLTDTLEVCKSRSTSDWYGFMRLFEREIDENKLVRRRLREDILVANSDDSIVAGEIRTLTSATQLVDVVDLSRRRGCIVVVMFHSHFVQACNRAQHHFRRMAENSAANEGVVFARIESTAMSESSLRSLEVERYPHVQMYKDGKCVASFSVPQTYTFRTIVWNSLDEVKRRQPNEWQRFYRESAQDIERNQDALNGIRSEQLRP